MLNVLVACEYSGTVRDAFTRRGYYAMSCDLLPSETDGPHYQGDVRDILHWGWDLMIAHPPCTHLAVSGARWFKNKQQEQKEALDFVKYLMDTPYIPAWCIENPVSVISTKIGKPDQIIQPWMFGHPVSKTTCLWLKNLPTLKPTNVVEKGEVHVTKGGKRIPKWYNLPPSEERSKIRSKTFKGIADAMANQWGPFCE